MKCTATFALALVLLGSACAAGRGQPETWNSIEVAAPSENVLWAVAGQEMQRMGFPVGSDADPTKLIMRSGWSTHLAPFRGQGYRELAEVRFTHLESGRYTVEARVERQQNMALARPQDPKAAEWEDAPDNVELASVILQRIRARLGDKLELNEPASKASGD